MAGVLTGPEAATSSRTRGLQQLPVLCSRLTTVTYPHLKAPKPQRLKTEIKTEGEGASSDESQQPSGPVLKAPKVRLDGFWTWGFPAWALRGV